MIRIVIIIQYSFYRHFYWISFWLRIGRKNRKSCTWGNIASILSIEWTENFPSRAQNPSYPCQLHQNCTKINHQPNWIGDSISLIIGLIQVQYLPQTSLDEFGKQFFTSALLETEEVGDKSYSNLVIICLWIHQSWPPSYLSPQPDLN